MLNFWKKKDEQTPALGGKEDLEDEFTREEKKVMLILNAIPTTSRDLILEGKNLTILTPQIRNWNNLTTINLSHNKLQTLPTEFFQLVHLEVLDITDNQLLEIPADIRNLTRLEVLMLSSNHIMRIPDSLFELSLSTLFLNDNNITTVSKKIAQMKNLITLSLANNRISKIPVEIVLLDELKVLMLQNNDIKEAPIEILNLKLDIKSQLTPVLRNQQIYLKDHLSNGVLTLKDMTLRSLTIRDPEYIKSVTSVDLSGNFFNTFPHELQLFENMTFLSLKNNQILKMSGISKCMNLILLDISQNLLDEFPREILDIKGLKWLKIDNNPYRQPLPRLVIQLDEDSTDSWAKLEKKIKRRQIFEELVETEQNYVNELLKIAGYLAQLEKLLFREELIPFLRDMQNILYVNEHFLKELNQLHVEHSEEDSFDIGLLFLDFCDKFLVYTDYINNYGSNYHKMVSEIDKNKRIRDFWAKFPEFASKDDIAKALSIYLISPIQRIPRYQILLGELKRNTPITHNVYENLHKGLLAVMEIADFCNSKKTEREFMDRVGDIAQELGDNTIVTPDRLFLYEVKACKRIHLNKKKRSARLLLFNDLVIVIESEKMTKIYINQMIVERIKDYFNRLSVKTTGFEALLEFESLIALEEFFQLWVEQNRKFWLEFYEHNFIEEGLETKFVSKVRNITNLRKGSVSPKNSSTNLPRLALEGIDRSPDPKSPSEGSRESDGRKFSVLNGTVVGPMSEPVSRVSSPRTMSYSTPPASPKRPTPISMKVDSEQRLENVGRSQSMMITSKTSTNVKKLIKLKRPLSTSESSEKHDNGREDTPRSRPISPVNVFEIQSMDEKIHDVTHVEEN